MQGGIIRELSETRSNEEERGGAGAVKEIEVDLVSTDLGREYQKELERYGRS